MVTQQTGLGKLLKQLALGFKHRVTKHIPSNSKPLPLAQLPSSNSDYLETSTLNVENILVMIATYNLPQLQQKHK